MHACTLRARTHTKCTCARARACSVFVSKVRTHARTHARMHAHTHTHTHARTLHSVERNRDILNLNRNIQSRHTETFCNPDAVDSLAGSHNCSPEMDERPDPLADASLTRVMQRPIEPDPPCPASTGVEARTPPTCGKKRVERESAHNIAAKEFGAPQAVQHEAGDPGKELSCPASTGYVTFVYDNPNPGIAFVEEVLRRRSTPASPRPSISAGKLLAQMSQRCLHLKIQNVLVTSRSVSAQVGNGNVIDPKALPLHPCPFCLAPPPEGRSFRAAFGRIRHGVDGLRTMRERLGLPVNKVQLSARMCLRSGTHQVVVSTRLIDGSVVDKEPFYAPPEDFALGSPDPKYLKYGIPTDDFNQRKYADGSEQALQVVRTFCKKYGPCSCLEKAKFRIPGDFCCSSMEPDKGCTCG